MLVSGFHYHLSVFDCIPYTQLLLKNINFLKKSNITQ